MIPLVAELHNLCTNTDISKYRSGEPKSMDWDFNNFFLKIGRTCDKKINRVIETKQLNLVAIYRVLHSTIKNTSFFRCTQDICQDRGYAGT